MARSASESESERPSSSRRSYRGSVELIYGSVFSRRSLVKQTINPFLIDDEFRIDPNDGNAYSKTSFILEYGGLEEWNEAERVNEEDVLKSNCFGGNSSGDYGYDEEGEKEGKGGEAHEDESENLTKILVKIPYEEGCRIDPEDGFAYIQEDFIEKYGGVEEWNNAVVVPKLVKRNEEGDGTTFTNDIGAGIFGTSVNSASDTREGGGGGGGLFQDIISKLPSIRMPLDEEYRVDAKSGEAFTKMDFITKYGMMIGNEKWDEAKFDAKIDLKLENSKNRQVELDPKEGDIVSYSTKGSTNFEGTVLKRNGLRLRVLSEIDEKQVWIELKNVTKIIAVKENKCSEFLIDILAVEFGRCKCGRTKLQHDASAIKRKAGLYREATMDIPKAAEFFQKVLKDHTLAHSAQRLLSSIDLLSNDEIENQNQNGVETTQIDCLNVPDQDKLNIMPSSSEHARLSQRGSRASRPRSIGRGSISGTISDFDELGLGGEEYRINEKDGYAYNKQYFLEEYGGLEEWNRAQPACEDTFRVSSVVEVADALRRSSLIGLEEEEEEEEAEDKNDTIEVPGYDLSGVDALQATNDNEKDVENFNGKNEKVIDRVSSCSDSSEEFRIDENDGYAYNKQSFLEEYGSLEEWNRAQPASTVSTKRSSFSESSSSGRCSNNRQRLSQVRVSSTTGAATVAAATAATAVVSATSADGGDSKVEYRIDINDGYAYSKENFISEYGGTVEWDKAAETSTFDAASLGPCKL